MIIVLFLLQTGSNSKYKKTAGSMLMANGTMMRKKLRLSKLEIVIPLYTEYGKLEETFS